MTDLKKLLAEAQADRPYTVSCEYGSTIVRTVCCKSKATLWLEDLAPQLAAALLKAEEALATLAEKADEYRECYGPGSKGLTSAIDAARATLDEIDALTGGEG